MSVTQHSKMWRKMLILTTVNQASCNETELVWCLLVTSICHEMVTVLRALRILFCI